MESNDKLGEINIKNRTCFYFDDMIKSEDFYLDNILIDEKSYENILVYKFTYKTLIGSKPLGIRLDKIDGFVRLYDRSRNLELFGAAKHESIYNRIRYIIGVKSGITYVFSHNYVRIKVDSFDSLPLEKTLTFHNVIILIKSVFIKDRNNYYNLFLKNVHITNLNMLYCDRIDVFEGIELMNQKSVTFAIIGIV